jgi:hypothetical protein
VEEASVRVRKEAQEASRADDGEQDDPPPKRQRLTTVKHESEWYGSRTLVTDAEGNFAGYGADVAQDAEQGEREGVARKDDGSIASSRKTMDVRDRRR